MSATRATWAHAERVAGRLSERDWLIVHGLASVRVLTGYQLTRLYFADLSPATRERTRRRVLARLAGWQVVTRLERTIGGVRAGSTGWIFALGPVGVRLVALDADARDEGRIRKPWTPSRLFLAHSLAVSELFVELTERSRCSTFEVARYDTEPACWWPDGRDGVLKPDAYVILRTTTFDEVVWVEVDRGTESLPTVRRKLTTYAEFHARGGSGPGQTMPHVLVSTTSDERAESVQKVARGLDGAAALFVVTTTRDAATTISALAVDTPAETS